MMNAEATTMKDRAPHPVGLISRAVFIETMRRREIYVLLILALVFLLGILVMNILGIENPATGTFLLNLGMSMSYFFALLLTLISASRQIPSEMENRTIYPLLAKPLKRSHLYLGKWAAVSLSGFCILVVLLTLSWFSIPKMESYHSGVLVQAVVLYFISMFLLASLAMLFSLLMPKGMNLVISAIIVFGGSRITALLRARSAGSEFGKIVKWISSYIPDFSKLNLTTRYTDGIVPVGSGEFLGLILYGVLFTIVFIITGATIFQRRSL